MGWLRTASTQACTRTCTGQAEVVSAILATAAHHALWLLHRCLPGCCPAAAVPQVVAGMYVEQPPAASRLGLVGLWAFGPGGMGANEAGEPLALDTSGGWVWGRVCAWGAGGRMQRGRGRGREGGEWEGRGKEGGRKRGGRGEEGGTAGAGTPQATGE